MSDRKYRHSGYQDSGPKNRDRGPSGPPPEFPRERVEGAPRGRSAGAPGPEVFKCNACGNVKQSLGELVIELDGTCDRCSKDMHTCSNCRFFDTSTRWECRQVIPARVSPKDVRNECELFTPRIVRDLAAGKGSVTAPDDARKAFDALFKK
ncbi:MAG: hypothetical protein ABI718_06285 [Acidobacteriota bacterium]